MELQILPDTKITGCFYLDNSKRAMYRSCKRKHYWCNIRGLQPKQGSTALRYGSTWHSVMEGYYAYIAEHGWKDKELAIMAGIDKGKETWLKENEKFSFFSDYRTFEAITQSFLQYLSYYNTDENYIKIITTEQRFECPITLETEEEKRLYEGKLPPIIFTGRIDLQLEMNMMNWLLDFKTTGQALSVQGLRLNRSAQLIGYSYAGERVLDFKPEGCLASLHQLTARKSSKTGEYGGLTIDFQRVPQIFTQADIAQWKAGFLDTCLELQTSIQTNSFPMNHDFCYQYGACSYTRLCEQNCPLDETNTDGFIVSFWDVLDIDE